MLIELIYFAIYQTLSIIFSVWFYSVYKGKHSRRGRQDPSRFPKDYNRHPSSSDGSTIVALLGTTTGPMPVGTTKKRRKLRYREHYW